MIGLGLIKAITFIEPINTQNKINLVKSAIIGLFFAPSFTVVPAGSFAGIYIVPANIKLYISLTGGHFQSALLLGMLPTIMVSLAAYFMLRKWE